MTSCKDWRRSVNTRNPDKQQQKHNAKINRSSNVMIRRQPQPTEIDERAAPANFDMNY